MRIDKNREINIFYPALVINDYYSAEFKDWICFNLWYITPYFYILIIYNTDILLTFKK